MTRNHRGFKDAASRWLTKMDEAIGQLHFDAGHNFEDATLLAGSARSGTTWIAEVINFDNSYRLIFEPLFRTRVPIAHAFSMRQYIRAEDTRSSFLDPVKRILSGRFRNGWSDRYNRQLFPRRRLIKEIRANLLLHWLHVHFPEVPIILLLRHPCAVIGSRLRRGWDHYTVRVFLRQEQLMADFLAPFKEYIEAAKTPLEIHLVHWCVETLVPLKQFKPGEIHVAFYENFRVKPHSEIARLFDFLGKAIDNQVFARMARRSKRTRFPRPEELGSPARWIDDWRQQFSADELAKIRDGLALFGLDTIYNEDGMPNERTLERLLEA